MKQKTFVLPIVVVMLALVLNACVPVPAEPMVMVAATTLTETEMPKDTLYLAQTVTKDFVLGPRSAFPVLPPDAAALLEKSRVPLKATPSGNIYLNRKWDLPSDQVVVLTSKDMISTPETPDIGMPEFSIKPSLAGKLVPELSVGISAAASIGISATTPLQQDWQVRIAPSYAMTGASVEKPIDFIHRFCLWCGCCEEFETVTEPMVMVAAATLTEAEMPKDTLFLAQTVTKDFVLGPRSAFPVLPPNAAALLEKNRVPLKATPLGSVYLDRKWDLPSDRVIVMLSLDNITTWEPPKVDMPGFSIKPSLVGKLAPGATNISTTIGISATTPLPRDRKVRIVPNYNLTAMPVDPIQLFCLICGCCEEAPR